MKRIGFPLLAIIIVAGLLSWLGFDLAAIFVFAIGALFVIVTAVRVAGKRRES